MNIIVDSIQNLPPYHQVFAQAQSEIISNIAKDDLPMAKRILKHNIIHAYTLLMVEKPQEDWQPTPDGKITLKDSIKASIEFMKLDEMSWEDLLITMIMYQSIAGIKPTQQFTRQASAYDSMPMLRR